MISHISYLGHYVDMISHISYLGHHVDVILHNSCLDHFVDVIATTKISWKCIELSSQMIKISRKEFHLIIQFEI